MSSYLEMQKLAQNPAAVASLATFLLNLPDAGWTEWEANFLDDISHRDEPLSTRQREKLVELRDDAKNYTKFDGLSVASLLRDCWIARFDLSEDDEEFIDALKQRSTTSLKKRPLFRLLRCARESDLLHNYVDIDKTK